MAKETVLNSVEEVIEDFRIGKPVIVVDDEDRENEGDFIVAAEKITPSGLEYLGTFHIPLTAGSLMRASTWSMSGPSAVMGTEIISTPKLSVTLKWRS